MNLNIFLNKSLKEQSQLIDKYLIPQELEKKKNAEVSTPYQLRQEMLDKIPIEFWTKPQKVFEPCCGKGGFVIDIIDRFMDGLKEKIKDEDDRYKLIVEECLYFSDINPTNIFICKLLVDPFNNFKLNYNEGNTLELDIMAKWNITGFDAVIGNPPYQNSSATGDNKLYLEFIKYVLNILNKNKYLLFITPINIKNYITNKDKNRKYINNFYEILYLSLNASNIYFKGIGMYFSYFLIRNNIVKSCKTKVEFLRNKQIETEEIIIYEKQELPLCLSNIDFSILNKCSNILSKKYITFDIKKAKYNINNRLVLQRIRELHIKNGSISKQKNNIHKYPIINKITKKQPFPGEVYYSKYLMEDNQKSKIIMCSGGYLMPSYDEFGIYNLSDNMIYVLCETKEKYNGFVTLINSKLIKYINLITMTDGLHGRDHVIQNMKLLNLEQIVNDDIIYKLYNLSEIEIQLINKTIYK